MDRRERRSTEDELDVMAGGSLAAIREAVSAELHAGRLLEAQAGCQRALEAHPDDPELLHLMASICLKAKQFDHAVEWASRAIRREAKPSYLLNLERRDDALKVFDKAVQLKPDDADLWRHMGNALLEAGRSGEALLCFQHAVELDLTDADAAYKAGVLLKEEGRLDEALVYLDRSADARPDYAPTFAMRGFVRASLNKHQ